MPLHDWKCRLCHKVETRFVKVADLKELQKHDCIPGSGGCGIMEIVFLKPPMGIIDIPAYQSPVNGRVINSRRQRKEDLLRNGCVEYEPGFSEETARRKAAAEEKEDAAIDSTVDEFITKLPVRKKELLDQELRAGATVSYDRL